MLDLSAIPPADPTDRQKLVVRGYPKTLCAVDYEDFRIRWRAFAGTGKYVGRPNWSNVCHTMAVDDVTGLESLDGLSGAPIFGVDSVGTAHRALFVGMALRGSKESGIIHFLEARVVCVALAKAHAERRG